MSEEASPAPDSRLRAWGWTSARAAEIDPGVEGVPARVVAQHRGEYRVVTSAGEAVAVAPGRMLHRASGRQDLPAVGDWVVVAPEVDGPATILRILPRATSFVRRKAGTESEEQVLAANVDVVFIVTSLNQELNERRIERYLTAAHESGAQPVVVLSKLDCCDDPAPALGVVRSAAAGAPVVPVSSVTGEGVDVLRAYLRPGETAALLGSSGVGKSTLVNMLAGEELLRTGKIRDDDDKGRHTTTHREIFLLPDGSLLLDTPGMRELGVVAADEGLEEAFDDVADIVAACKFRNCGHDGEPGCAVRRAIDDGSLTAERWASYQKLQKELAYEARRQDRAAALAETRRWKKIQLDYRRHHKGRK